MGSISHSVMCAQHRLVASTGRARTSTAVNRLLGSSPVEELRTRPQKVRSDR
jgi:hypothetical protein